MDGTDAGGVPAVEMDSADAKVPLKALRKLSLICAAGFNGTGKNASRLLLGDASYRRGQWSTYECLQWTPHGGPELV
jgi:hypothetical protein